MRAYNEIIHDAYIYACIYVYMERFLLVARACKNKEHLVVIMMAVVPPPRSTTLCAATIMSGRPAWCRAAAALMAGRTGRQAGSTTISCALYDQTTTTARLN